MSRSYGVQSSRERRCTGRNWQLFIEVSSFIVHVHLVSCMYINMYIIYAFVCLGWDQLFLLTIHLQLVCYAHVHPCTVYNYIHERNFLCCHRNQDTCKLFYFLLKVKCSLLLPFWLMMYMFKVDTHTAFCFPKCITLPKTHFKWYLN